MTKKHFEAAARIIKATEHTESVIYRGYAAEKFAQLFEQFNTAFDRARFFKACGLEG